MLLFWKAPERVQIMKKVNKNNGVIDVTTVGGRIKKLRTDAGFTQEQLADKIGTKKSYISRVENGHADIQLSTLQKIFQGLGRKVCLTIL